MPTVGQATLATIREIARERADMVGSSFVTDAEFNQYINLAYYELYDLLVQKYGDNYFVKSTPYSFTTDGTNDQYALPSDFYKLLGVDLYVGGGGSGYATLKPFAFADRNRWSGPVLPPYSGRASLLYRLNGAKLWLAPLPSSGQTVRVHYVPRLTALASDSDTADGVSGWEAYIIVDAARMALAKEESDVSVLMAEKQGLIARIEAAAENRDAGSPATVTDTQGSEYGSSELPSWGGS